MRVSTILAATLALLPLAACGDPAPRQRVPQRAGEQTPELAGGQTSEFSGGDVPLGYCPVELSRTALDPESVEVRRWTELVQGRHELPLRWQPTFPGGGVRGFEERTSVLLDVTVLAAEDVECGPEPGGSYEASGFARFHRRFELAIELTTTDGAVHATFQQPFYPFSAEGQMTGGGRLPVDQIDGALELGLDPGLDLDEVFVQLFLAFQEDRIEGTLAPVVALNGPILGDDTPRWSPVTAVFPAPDEGCESGTSVSLDESIDLLNGITPRTAYQNALARLAQGTISAAWSDVSIPSLARTEVALTGGQPSHACRSGSQVLVYTSLRIDSADGKLATELQVSASVHGAGVDLSSDGWLPRAEFEATAGLRGLDMGLAEYGGWRIHQSGDRDSLRGDLYLYRWEGYHTRYLDRPALIWCAGPECEQYWCRLTPSAVEPSCGPVER